MKIVKNSESYNINGTLEGGLEVSGSMTVSSENKSINFRIISAAENSNANEPTPMGSNEVGNYYWNQNGTRVNANYSVVDATKEQDFITASLAVVAEALASIETSED